MMSEIIGYLWIQWKNLRLRACSGLHICTVDWAIFGFNSGKRQIFVDRYDTCASLVTFLCIRFRGRHYVSTFALDSSRP